MGPKSAMDEANPELVKIWFEFTKEYGVYRQVNTILKLTQQSKIEHLARVLMRIRINIVRKIYKQSNNEIFI